MHSLNPKIIPCTFHGPGVILGFQIIGVNFLIASIHYGYFFRLSICFIVFIFLFENTENATVYAACASAPCVITSKTMIRFMRRTYLACKGRHTLIHFHSYVMFQFLKSLAILMQIVSSWWNHAMSLALGLYLLEHRRIRSDGVFAMRLLPVRSVRTSITRLSTRVIWPVVYSSCRSPAVRPDDEQFSCHSIFLIHARAFNPIYLLFCLTTQLHWVPKGQTSIV